MAKKTTVAPRGATPKVAEKEKRKMDLHVPELPWRWLLLPVIAVVGVFFSWQGYRWAYQNWPIEKVEVTGRMAVWNAERIAQHLSWVKGESFLSLDVDKVRQNIESLPLIAQVQVAKHWPSVLRVQIVEDVPIALWNDDLLLNANGVLSAIPPGLDTSTLTAIEGPRTQTQIAVRYFRRIQQLLNSQTVKVNSLKISAVGSIAVVLSNGWQVEFGRQYFEDRIIRLEQLLRYLPQEKVAKIDLRYGKGAAISWRTGEMS
ncbi:MAG: hypothetical protein RL217_2168 [Pseudomonadota bacterium]|jgi:cell division protein FtsQ